MSEIDSKNEPTRRLDAGNNRDTRKLYTPPTISTLTSANRTKGNKDPIANETTLFNVGPS
jgi:hypothetical protein